jgi:hypothetical protein
VPVHDFHDVDPAEKLLDEGLRNHLPEMGEE